MQENKSSGAKTVWIIVGIAIALLCCCLILSFAGTYWLYKNGDEIVANIEGNLDISYHINQAILAIGSGGLWGEGFGNSRQKFGYLPETFFERVFQRPVRAPDKRVSKR